MSNEKFLPSIATAVMSMAWKGSRYDMERPSGGYGGTGVGEVVQEGREVKKAK